MASPAVDPQEGHVLAPLGSDGRVQGARVQRDQGEPVAQGGVQVTGDPVAFPGPGLACH